VPLRPRRCRPGVAATQRVNLSGEAVGQSTRDEISKTGHYCQTKANCAIQRIDPPSPPRQVSLDEFGAPARASLTYSGDCPGDVKFRVLFLGEGVQ